MYKEKIKPIGKSDIISAIATTLNITKALSSEYLKELVTLIQTNVKNGKKVRILGFGDWTKSQREQRMGINPKTKEPMKIDGYKAVKFRVGKTFKDIVRNSK